MGVDSGIKGESTQRGSCEAAESVLEYRYQPPREGTPEMNAGWIVTRYQGGVLVTEIVSNWNRVGSLIATGGVVSWEAVA